MIVAVLAGLAAWPVTYIVLGLVLGLLSGPLPALTLLFRVQPHRTISWAAFHLLGIWAGWSVFAALAA
jgi:hypothetical protein